MGSRRVIAQSTFALAAMLVAPCAFADDAPVEKPAVDKPALPQGPAAPASPPPSAKHGEAPHSARQARDSSEQRAAQGAGGSKQRPFLYLGAGAGILSGLSGGPDFERTNPALTGTFGVEIPLARATGLGFELNGDVELAAAGDRGTYTALLFRARLARMLGPRNRLWGALGFGGAGYQSTSFAFGLAAGTSLLLVPKFGLDLSANLDLLSASSSNNAAVQNDYPGGAVFFLALRGLFELHR